MTSKSPCQESFGRVVDQNQNSNRLADLIVGNEEWLMNQILSYAKDRGYTKYTSTLKEAWRLSISGLSESFLDVLNTGISNLELGPDEDYTQDPAASFGILEAKRHRERGVDLGMFLGLMKYYRQSYQDLVRHAGFEKTFEERCRLMVERFFDRVELGFCIEWTALSENEKTKELQSKNRYMTNEKNKYLTIFESIQDPVILLDGNNQVDSVNHAWAKTFQGSSVPGARYYGPDPVREHIPWFAEELITTIKNHQTERSFEKMVETHKGNRHFQIKIKPMLDVSEKYRGTVVILNDITEQKKVEEAQREQERLKGVLEMSGAVCHEVNQPLMAILGYSELVKMSIAEDDPLSEKITKIIQQIDRLSIITQKLQSITRYETKKYLDSNIIDIDRSAPPATLY